MPYAEPVIISMLSFGRTFKIDAKLSAVGLELRFVIPNGPATNDELAHFTPRDVIDRMSNPFVDRGIVLDVRFDGRGQGVEVKLRGGIDFGLYCLVTPSWEGQTAIKIGTMHVAPWLDIYGLQDEMFFHENLYRYLADRRAAHLISLPPSMRTPEPPPKEDIKVVEVEVVEAEIVEAQHDDAPSASVVVFEATSEPVNQQSFSGLGLRRMMRSGLSFARDVAVDVASRTLARAFSGQ
jgi:hypothetical protein